MDDMVLLSLLTALLFLGAALKIRLKEKRGNPYTMARMVQLFIFPALCLAALIAYLLGQENLVVPVILLGIVEEILCWLLQKRKK